MSHTDRPDPENIRLANGNHAATPKQVFSLLEEQSIEHQTISHRPLYTVEDAKSVDYMEPGAHTKNCFYAIRRALCRNTYSTRLRVVDLLNLLDSWGHPVISLELRQG